MSPWLKGWIARMIEGFLASIGLCIAIIGLYNMNDSKSSLYGLSVPLTIFGFILALGAGIAWYFSESAIDKDLEAARLPKICQEDKVLMADLNTLFDDNLLHQLSKFDFGNGFRRNELDNIFKFRHTWNNTKYNFVDKELNDSLNMLKEKAEKFCHFNALKTFVSNEDPDFSRISIPNPSHENFERQKQRFEEDQKLLNRLADETFHSYEELQKLYKSKL